METQRYKVCIVVDRNFGERIAELARSFHVWVVESPMNTPAVQRFWRRSHGATDVDALEAGVTSFQTKETESEHEICARIARDVDEHHGEFAHNPAWSEIMVYGVTLNDRLRRVFEDLGATEVLPTPGGFICRR